ncbi:MAG: addiction module antitoxin [Solirubrobacterales bacterium]|nr:addiction module antitoxin [Solirubrobacterales bacterium]
MYKKLTIAIDRFIEELVRPHVLVPDLDAEYAAMAQDEASVAAALEWSEALIGDGFAEVARETW